MAQPSRILKNNISVGDNIPPIYLTIGTNDFLYDMNVKFVKTLKKLDIEHYAEFIEGYEHEWRFWNIKIEEFLDWIPRSDIYKDKKRRV